MRSKTESNKHQLPLETQAPGQWRSLRCVCFCEFGNSARYASSFCVVFMKPDTHQAISAYTSYISVISTLLKELTMGPFVSVMDLPTGKRKRKLKFSDVHEVTANLNILQGRSFIFTCNHLADVFIQSHFQERALQKCIGQ